MLFIFGLSVIIRFGFKPRQVTKVAIVLVANVKMNIATDSKARRKRHDRILAHLQILIESSLKVISVLVSL